MNITALNLIYYSPTGTTEKIIKKIASVFKLPVLDYNLTLPKNRINKLSIPKNSFTIIGMPVYSGRIPAEAADRISSIQGNNTSAAIIVVYGNRAYDDALLELKNLTFNCELSVLAAGAFIGEHSFSTSEKPLAANRPDDKDLNKAIEFGRSIIKKIDNLELSNYSDNLVVPGNFPYKELSQLPSLTPVSDLTKCNKCGHCADVCPTNAIIINGEINTNFEDCTWCCACVRACPENARLFKNQVIDSVTDKLSRMCSERKEPEFFI